MERVGADVAQREGDSDVLHLRGYSLPIMNDVVSEWTVKWLRDKLTTVWIMDSWRTLCAWNNLNENDNNDVGFAVGGNRPAPLPQPQPTPRAQRRPTASERAIIARVEPRDSDLIIETARRAADDANLAVEFMERDDLETALTWAKSVQAGANTLVLRLTDQIAKQQNPQQ